MKIFSPDMVADVNRQETEGEAPTAVVLHDHSNKGVLDKFSIAEDGSLLFNGASVGSALENADTLSKLSVLNGALCYNGQPVDTVSHKFVNELVLDKFSVSTGILMFNGIPVDTVGDSFVNKAILSQFSVSNGVLLFNGLPVDTVGHDFVNALVLDKFSVVNNVLMFNGQPVDTSGHVFNNASVLDLLTVDGNGKLLFNGAQIEGSGGTSLPNADVLDGFAVDINGALTYNGALLSSDTQLALTVNNSGTGVNVLKSVIGSDLYAKTLKAGSNITLDVTSDEIQINATLGGTVTASTTFKNTDAYTNTNVVANTSSSKILASEVSTSETGLLFLMRMGDDLKANITEATPIASGSVSLVASTSMKNDKAANFNGGSIALPNTTANSATVPASWFAGVADWTIEFDVVRSSSNQGAWQSVFSSWSFTSNTACGVWLAFDATNKLNVCWAVGSTTYAIASASAITDTNKHHIEANRSGGVIRLFIDGVLSASTTLTAAINIATNTYYLGKSADSTTTIPFYGQLRDFKVYNYAKHTAAYTVAGFYTDRVGNINTVDMSGKLLSSAFWKTVTSLTIASTETATAYLKWLMVDADGYWVWDSANSVWSAVDVANIISAGMTTSEVKAAFTNNPWNYRSDSVGFAVAFVTTDGASSPVLTSVTLSAVQSADKTSGHTVENQTQTMAQRVVLKFVGMDVSDDGNRTVVTAFTDSEKFTHNGQSLASVVSDLESNKGLLGGKGVDVSAGLADGVVLAYNQASGKFKPAVPAVGALGSGLFRTEPFTIGAGEEKTVTHQQVKDGRAVYQADQVVAGTSSMTPNRMLYPYDASAVDALIEERCGRSTAKLNAAQGSAVMSTLANMPVDSAASCSYAVDDYIYWVPTIGANWATQNSIYRAHISAPSSWTLTGDTVNAAWPAGGRVFRYKNTLFMCAGGSFRIADVSAPTKWTQIPKQASAPGYDAGAGAFLVGSKFYLVGGYVGGSAYTNNIYVVDLEQGFGSAWTLLAAKFPITLGRATSYQYGNYLYIIGGETTLDAAFSSAVYRASVADPTSWTQIGSYPVACSVNGACVVKNGKVFVAGGHQNAASLASVYMADAANPIVWTPLTSMPAQRFFVGMIELWDGFVVVGGMQGTSVSTAYATNYKYTLTPSIATTQGTITFNAVNLSLVQRIEGCSVVANLPAGTSIKSAVRIDGVWHSHDGTSFAVHPDMASALAGGSALTATAASLYAVPGLTDVAVNNSELAVALLLLGTANATPEVYAIKYAMKARDMYSPLLIATYGSSIGELALAHVQGDYNATNVKNKTSTPMSVVLKVYDGAL